MSGHPSIAGAAWLAGADLQRLLSALADGGETARIAGGAVRNALLGEVVNDVDIATTTHPDETARRAEAAGFRAVPTGAAHGTITVVAHGRPFEVTTLRDDVETDGRHARVRFGRDWARDAGRRDFTINALYADADGTVVDLVGGLADIEGRVLRFIGDAEDRIREDYLRILRFFRFFAWYGSGRPDVAGLKACAKLKDGLDRLSAERVWGELKKLLSAPDPSRALLWMRQTSVLTKVLPESEKWGIDAVHPMVRAEKELGWTPDALLRLAAIVPPEAARVAAMAARLRFSKAETDRLVAWADAAQPIPSMGEAAWRAQLYHSNPQALIDRTRLALAAARGRAIEDANALVDAGGHVRLLAQAESFERPVFPVRGSDLAALGVRPGPTLGRTLKQLEAAWVQSGFSLDRSALLERAAEQSKG